MGYKLWYWYYHRHPDAFSKRLSTWYIKYFPVSWSGSHLICRCHHRDCVLSDVRQHCAFSSYQIYQNNSFPWMRIEPATVDTLVLYLKLARNAECYDLSLDLLPYPNHFGMLRGEKYTEYIETICRVPCYQSEKMIILTRLRPCVRTGF